MKRSSGEIQKASPLLLQLAMLDGSGDNCKAAQNVSYGRTKVKQERANLAIRDVGDFKGIHEFCMVCSISYASKVQTAGVILLEPCDMGADMCKKAEKIAFLLQIELFTPFRKI